MQGAHVPGVWINKRSPLVSANALTMHGWVFSGDRINYAPLILAYGNRKRRIHNDSDSIEQYECNDLLYVNRFGARFVHEPALSSSAWLRLLHFFVQILWCILVSSEKPQCMLNPLPLGTAVEVLQPIIRVRSVHTDAMGVGFGT